ncbi:hypothetical protein BKA93DRAFT_367337 [Sparassis latifolia]|uniref:Uncharacterized protein n=1 Tax=Sparassis crispa TaxID=139825 RepID=A0A401G9J9_9APHY|nr:hypothetical protein SCP_0200390 [Sparassis crispa]GBE78842.1 hypothetical protein SCP_0200390 [Sparassis crispa]
MRHEIIRHLTGFDRGAYVATLESKARRTLPDAFRTWLLEWPARAVVGLYWAGLPVKYRRERSPRYSAVGRYFLGNVSQAIGMIGIWVGDSIDPRDPVYMLELYRNPNTKASLRYVFAGRGAGERLVGQVHSAEPIHLVLFHDENRAAVAKDWIGFLRGELIH